MIWAKIALESIKQMLNIIKWLCRGERCIRQWELDGGLECTASGEEAVYL